MSTSQTLGERQLSIYLTERGIDPKSIPPDAMREIIDAALASMELTELRNSQALVMYMGLLKTYGGIIADYCTKGTLPREASDRVACDILKSHGVPAGAA
jgi:hypothetical protein